MQAFFRRTSMDFTKVLREHASELGESPGLFDDYYKILYCKKNKGNPFIRFRVPKCTGAESFFGSPGWLDFGNGAVGNGKCAVSENDKYYQEFL